MLYDPDFPLPKDPKIDAMARAIAEDGLSVIAAARKADVRGSEPLAYRLSHHPEFVRLVHRLRENSTEITGEVTSDEVIQKLRRTYDEALSAGKFAEAAKCAELLGKHIKMFEDRPSSVVRVNNYNPSSPTELDRLARVAKMAEKKAPRH